MKWRKIVEKGRHQVSELVAVQRAARRRRGRRRKSGTVRGSVWTKMILAAAMGDLLLGILLH